MITPLTNSERIWAIIVLISAQAWESQGVREKASVLIPFNVPPTGGSVAPFYETDTRGAFPDEDILIRSITFLGVQAEGDIIPYHEGIHSSATHHHDLVFHHTILHQGSNDENQSSWNHFSILDSSTWSHGAIMYGTNVKNTSFGGFGLRLRKESPIFTCMHAKNSKLINIEFVALWGIEYEILMNSKPDLRSMVIGWYSIPPPPTTIRMNDFDENELKTHKLIEQKLVLAKNVKLVGWLLHHHRWVNEIVVRLKNQDIVNIGVGIENHPLPTGDKEINWLTTGNVSKNLFYDSSSQFSSNELGIPILKGEYLLFNIVAEKPTMSNNGPLGLSLFFTCDDGTDTLVTMHDLFSSQPKPMNAMERDVQLHNKVETWNKHVFHTSLRQPWR